MKIEGTMTFSTVTIERADGEGYLITGDYLGDQTTLNTPSVTLSGASVQDISGHITLSSEEEDEWITVEAGESGVRIS